MKTKYILLNENHGRYVTRFGGAWDTTDLLSGEELAVVEATSDEAAVKAFAKKMGITIRYQRGGTITDPNLHSFAAEAMDAALEALGDADEE